MSNEFENNFKIFKKEINDGNGIVLLIYNKDPTSKRSTKKRTRELIQSFPKIPISYLLLSRDIDNNTEKELTETYHNKILRLKTTSKNNESNINFCDLFKKAMRIINTSMDNSPEFIESLSDYVVKKNDNKLLNTLSELNKISKKLGIFNAKGGE